MKIKEITSYLESFAPLSYQESYDNSGLIIGNPNEEIKKILICLDSTEEIMDEAIKENCNLVIAHHPVLFKGLKKITGKNYVEKTIIKAIKNDIAIYAIHTNLDNVTNGVNFKIAQQLGLEKVQILSPKKQLLKKLIVFIPIDHTEKVLKALHESGAGNIGNYKNCSFKSEGTGTFEPIENADPFIGEKNKLTHVKENRVEVLFPTHLENRVLQAMYQTHPYETPAYDILLLDNFNSEVGSGAIGLLPKCMKNTDFLTYLKKSMNLSFIRYTPFSKEIQKIAVCGGAGFFLLNEAVQQQADAFITADIKYHDFFDANGKIMIADIGHYESEIATKDIIFEVLMKKFSNIAIVLSKTNTNPINYY